MTDLFCALIKSELGLDVVKEYRFHLTRKWRFDYCIPTIMCAIEVEGGAFSQGRHTRGKGFVADMEKYNTAVCLGWRLIRVTPSQLMTMQTVQYIRMLAEF